MHATGTAAHTAVILSFPVWPVGMPLCRALGEGLWEVRSTLPSKRIARVIFCFADDVLVRATRVHQEDTENLARGPDPCSR